MLHHAAVSKTVVTYVMPARRAAARAMITRDTSRAPALKKTAWMSSHMMPKRSLRPAIKSANRQTTNVVCAAGFTHTGAATKEAIAVGVSSANGARNGVVNRAIAMVPNVTSGVGPLEANSSVTRRYWR